MNRPPDAGLEHEVAEVDDKNEKGKQKGKEMKVAAGGYIYWQRMANQVEQDTGYQCTWDEEKMVLDHTQQQPIKAKEEGQATGR